LLLKGAISCDLMWLLVTGWELSGSVKNQKIKAEL
jgi:hypothetical protein